MGSERARVVAAVDQHVLARDVTRVHTAKERADGAELRCVTEAARRVLHQVEADGLPFVTATHDVQNMQSGAVMKRLGMEYVYSYQEHWQPKGKLVTFRLYQKNLREGDRSVYRRYWDASPFRCVEAGV